MPQPNSRPCGCAHAARTCHTPAPPGQQCAECTAGRHDHHNRYQPETFVPQPEAGIQYYRYRTSRDLYKVPTLTPDSADAEAVFAGETKLLGGAPLRIDWRTGKNTWRFAKRVPAEIRRNARIGSALHPNKVPYSIGIQVPSTIEFREAFPGVPLPSDCQTDEGNAQPRHNQQVNK